MPQGEHYRSKCVHGVVVAQCRCPGPKTVRVVPCPPSCERHPSIFRDRAEERSRLEEEERYARMQEAEL